MHARQTHAISRLIGRMSAPCAIALSGLVLAGLSSPDSAAPPPTAPVETKAIQQSTTSSIAVDECEITFLTGRKLTGLLMRSDESSVVLRINGIDTTYRRARIASIKFLPPVEERYRKIRASMPDSDIDGRLLLVDWLRDRRAYALAVEELDSILVLEPNHPQAKLLKTWLEQHLKLALNQPNTTTKSTTSSRVQKNTLPLLTEEQVNLIRVYEIDLSDPPRLIIEDSTIQELIARSPELFPTDEKARKAIFGWSDIERLKLLFRHKARDLYPQVKVLEDPASFGEFKKLIAGRSGWLTNGCAAMRCHGGTGAGRLQLSSQNPNSPETLYTNFLILERFTLVDGTPLISHTDPERSPLMHMGLVRSRSLYPHPEVDARSIGRDWRAIFRTTKSTNFKRTADWIRSLYMPRPDYGIVYPPATDQPTPSLTPQAPQAQTPTP